MIERLIINKLYEKTSQYPLVFLTGPRQSGKSTLLKASFPTYSYVSLEDIEFRQLANEDPRNFLRTFANKTIIDEAQRAPELFSYLQTHTDSVNEAGMYILSGSQNFLLLEQISQSLAGRVGILKLLPFSFSELKAASLEPPELDNWLFTGGYPRIYDKGIPAADFYSDYTQTYLERDIRLIKNIGNIDTFHRFIRLCAGRVGQVLNISALANACDISIPTARSWLSVLQTSYVLFLLPPYHRNFNKRLTKSPKLYFYDTGLACSLLGIQTSEQLALHYTRGALFENMVISECAKKCLARGGEPQFFFWRDNNETEIDLLLEDGSQLKAYEIKSSATMRQDHFKNLAKFTSYAGLTSDDVAVIFDGPTSVTTAKGLYLPWREAF